MRNVHCKVKSNSVVFAVREAQMGLPNVMRPAAQGGHTPFPLKSATIMMSCQNSFDPGIFRVHVYQIYLQLEAATLLDEHLQ